MPVADPELIQAKSIKANDRLIFPLDVPSVDEAKRWIDRLDGVVSFFKIGLELYAATGMALVPYLVQKQKRIFLDLKYYDIPETVEGAVRRVAQMGVSFLTVYGNGKIVRAAVRGRGHNDLKLLAVTVLTSMDSEDMKELGFDGTVHDLVLRRAQKALEASCDGVISSPEEAQTIRAISQEMNTAEGQRFLIVTPGIRPRHSSKDDHKRHSTPADAIQSGADYLVVGRPIREAQNPEQSAQEIVKEMQIAFDSRIQ